MSDSIFQKLQPIRLTKETPHLHHNAILWVRLVYHMTWELTPPVVQEYIQSLTRQIDALHTQVETRQEWVEKTVHTTVSKYLYNSVTIQFKGDENEFPQDCDIQHSFFPRYGVFSARLSFRQSCMDEAELIYFSLKYKNIDVRLKGLGVFNKLMAPLVDSLEELLREYIKKEISSAVRKELNEVFSDVLPLYGSRGSSI